MSNNKRLLAAISVAVMAASGTATANPENTTDLLQVYELALKNDAQLAAAQASFKASGESVPQSRAALLPQISLSAQTTDNRRQLLESNSIPGSNRTSNWNSHGWNARLSQPLFNLESWFTFERAGILTEQASLVLAIEQQNLIMRVSKAYFDVLRAEDSLSTAEAEEKAVKRQLEQTQQRFEVGLIAETDVLEARAAYDTSRVTRIQAKNSVGVAYENLRTLTNTPVSDLAKLDKTMPVATPAPASVENWVSTSVSQNLNLEAARKGVDAAYSQIKASRSGHAPTISAVATYGHNVDPSTGAAAGLSGKSNSTSYSLQVSLPIFSGGLTSSRVRESGYRLEQSQQQADQTLREVSANTRNLFNTVHADVERVEARCQGILSASSALTATESGYEVGTRNIVDVLNAQRSLYSAQRNYLNARYDFIVNTMSLKQVAGTLSPQDLKDLNLWMVDSKGGEETNVCS